MLARRSDPSWRWPRCGPGDVRAVLGAQQVPGKHPEAVEASGTRNRVQAIDLVAVVPDPRCFCSERIPGWSYQLRRLVVVTDGTVSATWTHLNSTRVLQLCGDRRPSDTSLLLSRARAATGAAWGVVACWASAARDPRVPQFSRGAIAAAGLTSRRESLWMRSRPRWPPGRRQSDASPAFGAGGRRRPCRRHRSQDRGGRRQPADRHGRCATSPPSSARPDPGVDVDPGAEPVVLRQPQSHPTTGGREDLAFWRATVAAPAQNFVSQLGTPGYSVDRVRIFLTVAVFLAAPRNTSCGWVSKRSGSLKILP